MERIIIPPKAQGESMLVRFPFTLPLGASITAKAVAATVYSGTDAAPNIISGSSIDGDEVKVVLFSGVLGVIYDILCTATISDGQVMQKAAYLAVVPT